jgi:hypothetical protein
MIELKRFLGATSFYRHYFQDFANKTAPMCKLLKKDEKFKWTKACNKSWERMKTSMTFLPIKMVPNWKIKFHVHIDASNFALGIMLGQNPDNTIDSPISHASRFMNNAKKNYKHLERKLNSNDICCEEI